MFIVPCPAVGLLDEALILVGEQMRLHLRHRVECDGNHDQQARAAEIEGHTAAGDQQLRKDTDGGQIERTDDREPVQDVLEVFCRILAGRMPGMKPPFFFRLSAVSVGLNTTVV